jgi:hypothetical protein
MSGAHKDLWQGLSERRAKRAICPRPPIMGGPKFAKFSKFAKTFFI